MSRLTEFRKDIEKYDYREGLYVGKMCSAQKIGQLEDLEEELGCPLEVLGKASNQKQIYVKKFNMYVEIRNIAIYEQATRPYIEYLYRDVNKVKVREVWIDEYKKTWWLKEDKSE